MRLFRTLSIVLAVALFVTACAGGNYSGDRDNGTNGTAATERAQGISGQGVYDSGIRTRSVHEGQLPGNGLQSPFNQGSIRPLNQGSNQVGLNAGAQTGNQQRGVFVPYVQAGGTQYIAAESLVQLLEFKNWEFDATAKEMQIGDTDVFLRLRADSTEAEMAEMPVILSAAPKMVNGKLMIPKTAVTDLFQEEMVFEAAPGGLIVYPSDTQVVGTDTDLPQPDTTDDVLDFADDPTDPFGGEDVEGAFLPEGQAIPALKNINMNSLIRTSKRYLGVKYRFGAAPYPRSHRFDCSSYTRYVYGKYGVKLPRSARAQARVGKSVSRKSLRKGDLLFFYVPGRFKSNKTVGHVGIYIGGGKMINANTAPKNGVQIRSIRTSYWKRTFLKAKRVAY